ncbi:MULTISPECIES: DsrE family protein [Sulfurimonas]|uniref:DsrE family protein n=1 Tax=Sulfurimonas TaxID=202746 RepID=UPI00125EC092|nr:DsrE family protein [Sulfurimonas hydrogeniphila]
MLKFTLILLSFCILSFADTEYAEPKPSIDNPRQIVFSVTEDSPHALDHILSVANNVLKFYGPEKVEMKIVAYSKGIKLLDRHVKETAVRVDALMQYDVEFVACGNTMRTLHIKKEDLVDGSVVVTAGVVELLESVKAGWIYIKP